MASRLVAHSIHRASVFRAGVELLLTAGFALAATSSHARSVNFVIDPRQNDVHLVIEGEVCLSNPCIGTTPVSVEGDTRVNGNIRVDLTDPQSLPTELSATGGTLLFADFDLSGSYGFLATVDATGWTTTLTGGPVISPVGPALQSFDLEGFALAFSAGQISSVGLFPFEHSLTGYSVALQSAQSALEVQPFSGGASLVWTIPIDQTFTNLHPNVPLRDPSLHFTGSLRLTGVYAPPVPLRYLGMQRDGVSNVEGLDGAFGLSLSPDGRHVYVTGYYDSAVAVFERSVETGGLSFVEAERQGMGGVDGLTGASAVIVSPDGKHVYVTGYQDAAIAIFARDLASGALTYLDAFRSPSHLDYATPLAVSPDGLNLYLASYDRELASLRRDAESGLLTAVEFEATIGALGVATVVSPDGKHVYVAESYDLSDPDNLDKGFVEIFERDPATGGVTGIGVFHFDSVGAPIYEPSGLAISPDGRHLYLTSSDSSLAGLERDPATGLLDAVELHHYSPSLDEGLGAAIAVAVSGDGRFVASVGTLDNALAIWARADGSGQLGFLDVARDGVDQVDGLLLPRSVAMSPDGRHVYVAALDDDSLVFFAVPEPDAWLLAAAAFAALSILGSRGVVKPSW